MLTASGSAFFIGHSEEEAWKHTGKVTPAWLLECWGRGAVYAAVCASTQE